MKFRLPQPSDCTACGNSARSPIKVPAPEGAVAVVEEFKVSLCTRCGHLMVVEPDGRRRNMTPDERMRLPRLTQAALIRRMQAEITEYMIG